jgi:hypothetical protein
MKTERVTWLPIETAPTDGTKFLAFDGKTLYVINQPDGYAPGRWDLIDSLSLRERALE